MSFFDDSIVLDDGSKSSFIEEEPINEDDVALAELGFQIDVADRFRTWAPDKNIIYRGKVTQAFVVYYLECSTQDMIDQIKVLKIPEKLRTLVDDAEPINEDLGKEHLNSDVSRYIEKNALLLQENVDLKADLHTTLENMKVALGNVIYLYRLMGKMEFLEGFELTDKDIKIITGIKEATGE